MTELKLGNNTFRVKKMNAIEALALRTSSNMNDVDSTTKFFNDILERTEVELNGQWLPVKQKGRNVFLPAGVENDAQTIKSIVEYFMKEFMTPFFESSNESKD